MKELEKTVVGASHLKMPPPRTKQIYTTAKLDHSEKANFKNQEIIMEKGPPRHTLKLSTKNKNCLLFLSNAQETILPDDHCDAHSRTDEN